jgi:mRNA-degrading endonuclease RelE of RelBE toxin-antitoxin system
MSAVEPSTPKSHVLTPEDVEAALQMLADEERAAPTTGKAGLTGFFLSALIDNLLIGFVFFAAPSGLIIICFRPWLGLELLGAGLVAIVLLGFKTIFDEKTRGSELPTDAGLADKSSGPVDEMIRKVWANKFKGEGCLMLPGGALWLGSLGWMLIGLITRRDVFPRVLIPIALGNLIILIANTYGNYRKFKFFSSVARVKGRLESLQSAGPEQAPTDVEVSEKDRELLSQVEIRQVNKAAVKGFEEYEKQSQFYSVAIGPEPLELMGRLDRSVRNDLRDVVADLQIQPRPAEAHRLDSDEAGIARMTLDSEGYRLVYAIDDSRQRVNVISINPMDQEVQRAS